MMLGSLVFCLVSIDSFWSFPMRNLTCTLSPRHVTVISKYLAMWISPPFASFKLGELHAMASGPLADPSFGLMF